MSAKIFCRVISTSSSIWSQIVDIAEVDIAVDNVVGIIEFDIEACIELDINRFVVGILLIVNPFVVNCVGVWTVEELFVDIATLSSLPFSEMVSCWSWPRGDGIL